MADEFSKKDGPRLDPRLTDFIDRGIAGTDRHSVKLLIVPALVEEYFAQARELPVEKPKLDRRASKK